MIARRSAYASVVGLAVAVVGVLWALASWRSGSPFPGIVVSTVACLTGFALGLVAEAVGSNRRDLRIGLAGLVGNALVAAGWGFAIVALWLGSS
jgi:hypothetical protein